VPASAVLGCGASLPSREVTNAELAASLGLSADAIAAQTGITTRRYVDEGLGPSDLGCDAARIALARAGREPADVDLIFFATMTSDLAFPGSGCLMQTKLAAPTVGAYDLRAQCAGFLFALASADRFVRAGRARAVLVVGGEVHSTALDFSPNGAAVTPVFGDGAGAVLLGPAGAPGVLAVALHSDPRDFERFWCEFPASRNRPARMTREAAERGLHYYRLDAAAVHRQAEAALGDVAREVLERAGVPAARLALAIVHYFDPRVARRAADALGLASERVVATAEAAGHVAGGGIPIALADATAAGRVGKDDLVLCLAFGAGMCWGAALLRL